MEEFGVNHADIISDMITSWSGTSQTIWNPLPALCPWRERAFPGLVATAYKTREGQKGLETLLYLGTSKENLT